MEFLGWAHSKFLAVHPGDAGQFALPSSHDFIILHAESAMLDAAITIGTSGHYLGTGQVEEFVYPEYLARVEIVVYYFPQTPEFEPLRSSVNLKC